MRSVPPSRAAGLAAAAAFTGGVLGALASWRLSPSPRPVRVYRHVPPSRRRLPLAGIVVGVALLLLAGLVSGLIWIDHRQRIESQANAATGGLADRAQPVMLANGCGGCHTISGVPGAQGLVGPALDATLARRTMIGGVVRNTPENLVQWIRAAREFNPHGAMPSTGISEQDARDVAAYLYALK